jgi:hypothetical protein
VCAVVGRQLCAREVHSEAALANQLFAVWWGSVSVAFGALALLTMATALDGPLLALTIGITYVLLLNMAVGLAGLSYYLLYLYTGRARLLAPLAAYHGLAFAALAWVLGRAAPDRVDVGLWSVALHAAHPQLGGALRPIAVLALALPTLIGAAAYVSLLRRMRDPTQRWRIALVAGSILAFLGSLAIVNAAGAAGSDAWQLANRALALAAALAIYGAYHPPAWARARWRLHAIGDAPPPAALPPTEEVLPPDLPRAAPPREPRS